MFQNIIYTSIFLSLITISHQQNTKLEIDNRNIRKSRADTEFMGGEQITENHNSIIIDAAIGDVKIVTNNKENNQFISSTPSSNDNDTISESGSCICVPYYLCRKNQTIITDGTDIIDIRSKAPDCNDYLEICCKAPLNPTEITTETIDKHPKDKEDPMGIRRCGRRNFDGAGVRIRGDFNNEAQFGEFPWMVAVLRTEKIMDENITMNIYQCGGSLIHPRVILTAAHCVANRDSTTLLVRAGEWDTQTKNERLPHIDLPVEQVIVHQKFYSGGLYNDIALLITEKPYNLTDHIDTVCLPPQGLITNDVMCTASGWGKDKFGKEGNYQVILKKVDLPMVDRNYCENQLRTTRLTRFFQLHESFVCAGGESGRDTCKGDGGSPLVCPVDNQLSQTESRYYQSGIVAWGVNCGEDNIPGVYVNVALFRNWIDNWMKKLNFDTRYYIL